ncbi:MAG: sensor protein KdpD [Saprospiraceae bacterium]|nr:sensor protein KdpD [Saprospiraceae bacterium]
MPEIEREQSAQRFLDLIKRSRRGKFKLYLGMAAGVGKTYRMLQEAHALRRNGIDVRIGYVETHGRTETEALTGGLPLIPRRKIFYKGKELEEMDIQSVLNLHPEVVIVDELAHTNVEGSKNAKRWQDVLDLLNAGINVISALNIQHLESLNDDVRSITGIEVRERVPDSVLREADEVINIDLSAEELIQRLREGKIYAPEKVELALRQFFQPEYILQLRELALHEAASHVGRKVEAEIPKSAAGRHERMLACISSNADTARHVIRKTARLASYYNARWWVLYVQTPAENPDKIPLAVQRHLHNNLQLALESGATIIRMESHSISEVILDKAMELNITTLCIGKPHFNLGRIILNTGVFNRLLKTLGGRDIDIIILS